MTIRQNTLTEHENVDMALLKNWDQQKTMPIHHSRGYSSKKRKTTESKKSERKSERKSKNKSLVSSGNTKSMRYDLYKPRHQYNQSMGVLSNHLGQTSLHSTQNLVKNPIYSSAAGINGSQKETNMKSQISKKMIKNFMKTQRENDQPVTQFDVEKERTFSNDKKHHGTRKTANSKDKKSEQKRPRSGFEKIGRDGAYTVTKIKRIPKTYMSPNNLPEEPRPKTKVKVYKLEKDKITEQSSDRQRKHLKSKSQANLTSDKVVDHKAYKYRNTKVKKCDIYGQGFSSTEYLKQKIAPEGHSKITSPDSQNRSPVRTVSNFNQMKKAIAKVKTSRPHYAKKGNVDTDSGKNSSLIAESGCSGFFGNNRSKGECHECVRVFRWKHKYFSNQGFGKGKERS